MTDSLNEIADNNRAVANTKLDEKLRGKFGQFMSSTAVSSLMAQMFEKVDGDQRILDAGAGVGSLTAAFVEHVEARASSIDSTCFELSKVMNTYLADTMEHCARHCESVGIDWKNQVVEEDFISHSVKLLVNSEFKPNFNKAILNPPYLKISAKGEERKALRKVNFETGNLYSAFVGLAIMLLEKGGELVAITPRSFCNGPYFNDFRRLIFDNCSLNKIHVFNSRKSAFKTDKVLQENVVFHLTKNEPQRDVVVITSSSCAEDPNPYIYEVPFDKVVSTNNPDRFIHIVTNEAELNIADRAGNLPCSLSDIGIQASTGKVVDFRTRENLSMEFVKGSVPLIFPQHLQGALLRWPLDGGKKPNALMNNENTSSLMVKNGTYVLTRRLTAKEEKRRLVASIYSEEIADVEEVGFENKTNYFHAMGEPLEPLLAKGLWAFLNSTLIDKYFRQLNGHTQVNATDLRVLRYPDKATLTSIGKLVDATTFEQEKIDEIIEKYI